MFMTPIEIAIAAPLRSLRRFSVALLLTVGKATGPSPSDLTRRTPCWWLDRDHAQGGVGPGPRRAVGSRPRAARHGPRPRSRLPAGARHGVGAGPGDARRLPGPRVRAAPRGALRRGGRLAGPGGPGDAAPEAGAARRSGRRRCGGHPAARPR